MELSTQKQDLIDYNQKRLKGQLSSENAPIQHFYLDNFFNLGYSPKVVGQMLRFSANQKNNMFIIICI